MRRGTGAATGVMSRFASLVFVLPFCSAAVFAASTDLTPEIYDPHFETNATVDPGDVGEGCAGAATGRTLLRFGTRVTNLGPDDLVIGNPDCPDCRAHPGATCGNPQFVCSSGLYKAQFRSAARFELLDPARAEVIVGSKRGYCFNDDTCNGGKTPVRAVKSAGTRRRCDVQAASQQIGVLDAQLTLMTARQQ
jgi:hypothetical protein